MKTRKTLKHFKNNKIEKQKKINHKTIKHKRVNHI